MQSQAMIEHLRAQTSKPPLHLSPHNQTHGVGTAVSALAAIKRNDMFKNWIFRGMPTIVLLVVAGIIEILAIHAFA
jgi:hypothetical protein